MEEATWPAMLHHHTSPAEEQRELTAQLRDTVVVVTGGAVDSARRPLRRLQDMRHT
jgi:hypothetical protein